MMQGFFGTKFGRAVGSGALIALMGLFAMQAGKQGLSDFYVQSARQEIESWSAPGRQFRGDEWPRVLGYLTEALRYAPNSAWPLEEMGALQLRRMRAATDPLLAVAAVRAANVNFHMALMERPTSPFAWVNLALTKLYLDEIDGELFDALGRAQELGPWEPEVQQLVVFIGLAAWQKLDSGQRAAVVRTMERGARKNAGKIAEIAKGFNRFDLICGISETKLLEGKACSRRQDFKEKSKRQ